MALSLHGVDCSRKSNMHTMKKQRHVTLTQEKQQLGSVLHRTAKHFLKMSLQLSRKFHQCWTWVVDIDIYFQNRKDELVRPTKHKKKKKRESAAQVGASWATNPKWAAYKVMSIEYSSQCGLSTVTTHSTLQCPDSPEQRSNKKGEENWGRGTAKKPLETEWRRGKDSVQHIMQGPQWGQVGTGQHSVGTEDQRDTHLNHRNKPLTLRFSGSTVFKPIKKQGRGQQGTVSNIQKIKKQNVISY